MRIFSRFLLSYSRQCVINKCSFSTTVCCPRGVLRGRRALRVLTAEEARLYDQGKLKTQEAEVSRQDVRQHALEAQSERFTLPEGVVYTKLANEDRRFR